MLSRLLVLVAACWPLAATLVQAEWQPDAVLVVDDSDIAPDCTVRRSIVFNGTSPGPLLRFKEGDRVWVRVLNNRDSDNTTVHFHGLSQYLSPYADGTPKTSQWPIAPGSYFDYEFDLQPGSAGT